ncbi:MAG: gamma-glutamyltransferase [Thermodesulfobacteriota bacterium]
MKGVISAGHELTARAGAEMLEGGGNAFDAALAAAFASFVCEAALTSPGGGGFLMAHTGHEDKTVLYDFFPTMPGLGREGGRENLHFYAGNVQFGNALQVFHIGRGAAAVPGCMAGLAMVHERHCTLPLTEIMAPAISYAREGFPLNAQQAAFNAILTPILTASEESKRIYAPHGPLLTEGEMICNHDMADLLDHLSREGLHMFYRGEVADRFLDTFGDGGLITREDIEAYRVVVREPLVAGYRGRKIYTNPPPSSGGCLIAFALKLLEPYDIQSLGHNTASSLRLLMEAMRSTNEARGEDFDHRIYEEGLAEEFLSDDNVALYLQKMVESVPPDTLFGEDGLGSTTHISVTDKDGNAATITTSNGVGCGFMIPGTGVMLNSILGEEDLSPHGFHRHETGKRISSMMAPTIVMYEGKPEIVLGSGGSKRIRSAILQAILNIIDHNMTPSAAVNAPRVQWEEGVFHIEEGIEEAALASLTRGGVKHFQWGARHVFFGGVHAVVTDHVTGVMSGGGDQRRGGFSINVS